MKNGDKKVAIGDVEMILDILDGKVMQRFKEPMVMVLYDHQNAIDVAGRISDLAFEIREGVKPAGPTIKQELIDRHRKKLLTRLELVFNKTREDKTRSNAKLAEDVVDICLWEIFS